MCTVNLLKQERKKHSILTDGQEKTTETDDLKTEARLLEHVVEVLLSQLLNA
jgi:hypothetical protein